MKLEYLYIDGYKGLKRLKLQFKEQTGAVPVDFLIGCNGSGKSSVLEAVGPQSHSLHLQTMVSHLN